MFILKPFHTFYHFHPCKNVLCNVLQERIDVRMCRSCFYNGIWRESAEFDLDLDRFVQLMFLRKACIYSHKHLGRVIIKQTVYSSLCSVSWRGDQIPKAWKGKRKSLYFISQISGYNSLVWKEKMVDSHDHVYQNFTTRSQEWYISINDVKECAKFLAEF